MPCARTSRRAPGGLPKVRAVAIVELLNEDVEQWVGRTFAQDRVVPWISQPEVRVKLSMVTGELDVQSDSESERVVEDLVIEVAVVA